MHDSYGGCALALLYGKALVRDFGGPKVTELPFDCFFGLPVGGQLLRNTLVLQLAFAPANSELCR